MNNLFRTSGEVKIEGVLVSFLYELMRDIVPPGKIEELVLKAETTSNQEIYYSNGWLAKYAENLANRLTKE